MDSEQEWESSMLGNRHYHNRTGHSPGSKSKQFNARKLFGSYGIKIGKSKAMASEDQDSSSLELYNFSPQEDGIYGSLMIPRIGTLNLVLAGSRKALNALVEQLSSDAQNDSETGTENLGRDTIENSPSEDLENVNRFEKNSFRSPKFWMRWQSTEPDTDSEREHEYPEGTGYLVFQGNDCNKFTGTISSTVHSWDNKLFTGWKTLAKAERDFDFAWL